MNAKGNDDYLIELSGYAFSASGAALNQKLSEDRAKNVLAHGALGGLHQVDTGKTTEGQAENLSCLRVPCSRTMQSSAFKVSILLTMNNR